MDDYLKNITFQAEQTLTREEIKSCISLVNADKGILDFRCANRSVSFEYSPYLISQNEINDLVESLGIRLSHLPERTGFFRNWLSNAAKENKQIFGTQRLNCCSINYKNSKK